MARQQIKKTGKPWHTALIHWMLANPTASAREAATHFKVSQTWLSILKNSDAFKEAYAKEQALYSSAVVAGIAEKMTAHAELGIDIMSQRLEESRDSIDIELVHTSVRLALETLGYTRAKNGGPETIVNIGLVSPELLSEARENMRRLGQTGKAIEHGELLEVLPTE